MGYHLNLLKILKEEESMAEAYLCINGNKPYSWPVTGTEKKKENSLLFHMLIIQVKSLLTFEVKKDSVPIHVSITIEVIFAFISKY